MVGLLLGLVLGRSALVDFWTLNSEASGFFISHDTVGTLSGTHTFPDPNLSWETTLFEQVYQDKGDSTWDVPWSHDLAELYYDATPYTFSIPAGTVSGSFEVAATIRTDWHDQRWQGLSSGSALRLGFWDTFQSTRLTVIE